MSNSLGWWKRARTANLKRRSVAIAGLAAIVSVGTIGAARAWSRNEPAPQSRAVSTVKPVSSVKPDLPHNFPRTEGQLKPELIPDAIAYGFFLKAIARKSTGPDEQRVMAYLRHVGLIKTSYSEASAEERRFVDKVRDIADELTRASADLDASTASLAEVKDTARLEAYRQQKLTLVSAAMTRLTTELSTVNAQHVWKVVAERVKPHITIIHTSTTPASMRSTS
jgi:hypothetical protein